MAATDRGAKAVNVGFALLTLVGGLNAGVELVVAGGGRAGREAWVLNTEGSESPGGAGYDMMNVCP